MSNRAKMIAVHQAEKVLDEYCLEVAIQQACINISVDCLDNTYDPEGKYIGKTAVPESTD